MRSFLRLPIAIVVCLAAWRPPCASAWVTTTSRPSSCSSTSSLPMVLDPASLGMTEAVAAGLPSVGIALASAAAGAASQLPARKALEEELAQARADLEATKAEAATKLAELEDKLFEMDEEFEAQTARFQRRYDQQKRAELEEAKSKLRADLEFQLKIKVEQEKSRLLTEQHRKMEEEARPSKTVEASELRLQRATLLGSNEELEEALSQAKAELDRLKEAAAKSTKKFLGLF